MKNNILRGKILRLLSDMYPDGIERTSLIGIYHAYEHVDDIGYCTKTETPHPYKANISVIYFKITPAGLDLIEGNCASDAGILIPLEA